METKNSGQLSETALIDLNLLKVDKEKLGEGGYGVVYRGTYQGMDVAIKKLLVQDFSPAVKEEFYAEAKTMLLLRDSSVVHLYGITENPYQMIMEFCSLGSLKNYLQNSNIEISWSVRFHLGTGIASGLYYLHTRKPIIIHGDLKSLNVLLAGDKECPNPKLADFGLADVKTESQNKLSEGGCNLYLMPFFSQQNLELYRNSYILVENKLGYVTFSAHYEDVTITDITKFLTNISAINPKNEKNKLYLSDKQVNKFITLNGGHTPRRTNQGGTIPWAAPEVLSLKQKTTASDIYAFGITLWEIASRTYPYKGLHADIIRSSVKGGERADIPEGTPKSFSNIFQVCWDQDPKKRFSAKEALQALQKAAEKEANTNTNQTGSSAAPYKTGFVNSLNTSLENTQKKPSTNPQYSSQARQYKSIFQPEPEKVLSVPEQVEQMSTVTKEQNQIRQVEVQTLLKWVTEGHLVEVETLLKKNPILGVCTGTIKDLSDRTFNNITALQYAAWSLDQEMCDVIMDYVGTHHTAIQLKALYAEPDRYSTYGDHYDIKPLMTKTKKFVNYRFQNYNQRSEYWQKKVGGEQRKCPAWLIYAWSEPGEDVAWTKPDFSWKVKREYGGNLLDWWLSANHIQRRAVGDSLAVLRGSRECCQTSHHPYSAGPSTVNDTEMVRRDTLRQEMLDSLNDKQLAKLKSLSGIHTLPCRSLRYQKN